MFHESYQAMSKHIFYYLFLFCALVSKDIKAQNTHWQVVSSPAYGALCFYEDTSQNLLYIGGSEVSAYDGNIFTQVGSINSSGGVRHIIKYQDTLYASAFDIGFGLMKWNGTTWDTAGVYTDGIVGALYVYNGELYVSGWFTTIGGINANGLAKFDGTNWSVIGNLPLGYNYGIWAITMYNGELYIGGSFGDSAWNTMNILRWNGSQWNTVGSGFNGGMDEVSSFEVFNNILYIGGSFRVSDGNAGNYIVKWDGTTLSDVGGGVMGLNNGNGQVRDLVTYNNTLYVAGVFSYAGGIWAQSIAKWDGVNWCGFGDTLNNSIIVLGTYNGELYIGGNWWIIGSDTLVGLTKWIGGNYVDTCANMTGIKEQTQNFSMQIFPNPTAENFTLRLSGLNGKSIQTKIIDILGQTVMEKKEVNTSENFEKQIDVSGLGVGIYMVMVRSGDMEFGQKIIIQH